ncbi:Fur family transcriptional regulator [Comamonas antarctica]|uniref:Transcriptional repressor n=1 Tax=Comamonas antarctica TaxID=2743470 RepID=A0A6N1XBM6_9BURK|nr:Fur family transcriptional regulator [Comamonas antarctica]QKV55166.1 transcriptional repressor [Comamonas antarctica]
MPPATHPPTPALTRHQSLVLGALAREDAPASAYALLSHLQGEGLRAPQQVYRALDKLIEYGLVHRVETMNAFVACAHPHAHAQGLVVFAICDQCGHVDEFSDSAIEQRLQGWSRSAGFRMKESTVELHGDCARCQAAGSREAPAVAAMPAAPAAKPARRARKAPGAGPA